jgi:hypothetical protein
MDACLCLPIPTLKPAADALAADALELAPSSKAGLFPYTSRRLILKRHILATTIAASLVAAGCLMVVQTAVAAETASVEVAFSPDGGAENIVLGAINGAQRSIRLMAYSFTAEAVARWLAHGAAVSMLLSPWTIAITLRRIAVGVHVRHWARLHMLVFPFALLALSHCSIRNTWRSIGILSKQAVITIRHRPRDTTPKML